MRYFLVAKKDDETLTRSKIQYLDTVDDKGGALSQFIYRESTMENGDAHYRLIPHDNLDGDAAFLKAIFEHKSAMRAIHVERIAEVQSTYNAEYRKSAHLLVIPSAHVEQFESLHLTKNTITDQDISIVFRDIDTPLPRAQSDLQNYDSDLFHYGLINTSQDFEEASKRRRIMYAVPSHLIGRHHLSTLQWLKQAQGSVKNTPQPSVLTEASSNFQEIETLVLTPVEKYLSSDFDGQGDKGLSSSAPTSEWDTQFELVDAPKPKSSTFWAGLFSRNQGVPFEKESSETLLLKGKPKSSNCFSCHCPGRKKERDTSADSERRVSLSMTSTD